MVHAADYFTIPNTFVHNHFKASLIGHSYSNGDEDTGHLIVTYANNCFKNINTQGPSMRFRNSLYLQTSSTGLNPRISAQLLIETSVFSGIAKAIQSADSSTLKTVPYEYSLLGLADFKAAVAAFADATLNF